MDKTCEERINDHLASRLEDIDKVLSVAEMGDNDQWYDYPLGADKRVTVEVLLSTGGPADWFECFVDVEDRGYAEIYKIVYHFSDWFDHAERRLDDKEYFLAKEFCQPFVDNMFV